MFSNTAEYALRAIVHLAVNRDRACPASQIAEATQIPSGYVSKVLQDLGRAGLVNSQRGPNGGFTLARDASEISVLEAVNAVDPIHRITKCPLGIPSHGTQLCRLHHRLDQAIESMERVLGESSIAEMIEPSRTGTRCLFPPVKLSVSKGRRKSEKVDR
jgi:Rrf2 family protein